MKTMITQRMRAAPVLTWAAFPGPTLAPQGLYFFSDIGIKGSLWYNNGATIEPVGPIVLHRVENLAASSNGTAEEAYAISNKIPGGVLAIGRVLEVNMYVSKSSTTEQTNHAIKLGTNSNGLTGAASIGASLGLNTTNRQLAHRKGNMVTSATQMQGYTLTGSTVSTGISTSAPPAKVTIPNVSNDMYVSLTCTKTTGGIETVSAMYFDVILK